MSRQGILILGGGFAGLSATIAAARKLDDLGACAGAVELVLVNRDAYHSIRVRNYETDLSAVRVSLGRVLGPIGVRRVEGEVTGIDVNERHVMVSDRGAPFVLSYDRLILALGSELARPDDPAQLDRIFDIDTYAAAERLASHLRRLPKQPKAPGRFTAVVVGSGATDVELAAELPRRLGEIAASCGEGDSTRVILLDRGEVLYPGMSEAARGLIRQALGGLGVEIMFGRLIIASTDSGVLLDSMEEVASATVVWCAGMRARPLIMRLPVPTDHLGRCFVDEFLKVSEMPHAFAAGDVAHAHAGGGHSTMMSCQHSRQTGRYAGSNAACNLLGEPMQPLQLAPYVTVVDLGPAGAIYTEGWEREPIAFGDAAKRTKEAINRQRIYPPLSGNRDEILASGAITSVSPPTVERN